MTATLDQTITAGNRGSHYNPGTEYIYFVNETTRQISRQPVNPVTLVVQQASKQISSGQSHNLNSFAAADVRWTGSQLQGLNGTKLYLLAGYTAIDQIPPDALTGVPWGPIAPNANLSETGQSVTGSFYAVRMLVSGADPHYAKLRIYKEGGVTKAEWVTYTTSTKPWVVHVLSTDYPSPRDIVVSPYDTDIYVSGGGANGYVIQIPRVLGGPFPQYYAYPTPLNGAALDNPQQMVIDGGVIYVVAEGGLFLLDPANGVQIQVVSGITAPVGLLLDKQSSSTKVYISDSVGGIYIVDITAFDAPTFDSNGDPMQSAGAPIAAPAPSTALALGGASGFLSWANDTHTVFYATVVGPAGKVKRVDLLSNAVTDELTALDPIVANPWSIEVFDEHSLTVICDAAIFDAGRGIPISAELLLGLGLIPFDFINNSVANPATPGLHDGKANTSSVPGYYFSAYPNLPFGGSLSLLINHDAAWNSNLRYYKVSLTNDLTGQTRVITNSFVDLRWSPTVLPPRFEGVTTGVQSSVFFPIRNPADLWYNPYLAAILNTALSDNGHNRLKIEFFDANKQAVAGGVYTRLIYIDNTGASVTLMNMRRGTTVTPPAPGDYQASDACGLIAYDNKNDLIEFDFTACHPSGIGAYTLSFYRGGTRLFFTTGNVTSTPTLLTVTEKVPGTSLKIGHLTGNCDIAGVSVGLSVPSAGAINGYGWLNLGAYASRGFSLAKAPLNHTVWP